MRRDVAWRDVTWRDVDVDVGESVRIPGLFVERVTFLLSFPPLLENGLQAGRINLAKQSHRRRSYFRHFSCPAL